MAAGHFLSSQIITRYHIGWLVLKLRSPRNGFQNGIKGKRMANQSIVREFWDLLKMRKRYWLIPILIILGVLSALIVFTESSVIAPFIYTLY